MIAEFMLRRTKAEQVVPVYNSFLNEYPDIKSLASADLKDVSKFTLHLGLHWRAADFVNACKLIETDYKGIIPNSRKDLLKIPGVGDYVAGVILTVCFGKSEYVIDSNIARFINRFYGLGLTGEIRRKRIIIEKAVELFNCKSPDKLLFSILDFTALVCKPKAPKCKSCIIKNVCMYEHKI